MVVKKIGLLCLVFLKQNLREKKQQESEGHGAPWIPTRIIPVKSDEQHPPFLLWRLDVEV